MELSASDMDMVIAPTNSDIITSALVVIDHHHATSREERSVRGETVEKRS
jgi:hypothetical protein